MLFAWARHLTALIINLLIQEMVTIKALSKGCPQSVTSSESSKPPARRPGWKACPFICLEGLRAGCSKMDHFGLKIILN